MRPHPSRRAAARRAAGRLAAGPLAAALALGACGDGTAPAPPPATAHDLLVVARPRGFDELVVLPLDGGAPRRVSDAERSVHHPAPSPDGRRLAFVDLGDDEVWIAGRDGARQRNVSQQLAAFDAMPAWSPDGARLVFASDRDGRGDLYVVGADGGGLRRLTPDQGPAAAVHDAPAWSPDGSRIAFSSDRGGAGRQIWTVRPDGTDLRQLTHVPAARDHEPAWSPDGRRLVVRRVRHEATGTREDLAIVDAATGAELADLRLPGRERSPSWSPDGAWIAFASDPEATDYRVQTVRPDGTGLAVRAAGPAFGRHAVYPRWLRRR